MAVTEQKPPPIRTDLEIVPQYYRGQLCYVAKDPVTLNYYRLGEAEYIVLKCFQRGMGVEQIQREVKNKTGQEVSSFEIYKFANQLQSSDLLKSKGMGDVRRLARNRRKARRRRVKQFISSYLFITIPLWDPDRFLDRLMPAFRLIWRRSLFLLWLVLTGAALYVIVENFGVLVADAFSLLSGWNLLILSGVVFGVKFVHELGHALTCKHFGREVHAIGPAFLVFQPCMFTDTSDAWLLPSKWDRIKVTSAGIFIEVMLAAVAALVWICSEPGFLKQVAYTTMVTCSISTVLFNANPLLRFDGYYILSDLLEIPNLRIRSEQYLGWLFDRYVLGLDAPAPKVDPDERTTFVLYAVARAFYKAFIVLSIGFFLYSIFEPLGIITWATSFYGMVLMPLWKRGQRMAQQYNSGKVRSHYLLVVAGVIALAAGLLLIPIAHSVDAPCVVTPAQASVVRAAEPGRMEEVLVAPGARVEAGQALVRMSAPALTHRAERMRHLLREVEVRLRQTLAEDAAAYTMQQRQKKQLTEELRELEARLERLVLRAPHAGVVVDLHRLETNVRTPQHGFVEFPLQHGAAYFDALVGARIDAGTGILAVASTEGYYLETFVYERDLSDLSPGDRMVCMLRSGGLETFETYVQSITPVDVKAIENVGITLADVGYIPVKPSAEGQQPLVTLFRVRSGPQLDEGRLLWGQTGKARIVYGRGPAGKFYFGRIVRALRLRLQRT